MAIETVLRVWNEEEGVALEVSDFPGAPQCLQIKPFTAKCKDWFGDFTVVMDPQFAIALGHALISVGTCKMKSKATE